MRFRQLYSILVILLLMVSMFVACKNDNIDQRTTDPTVYAFEEEDNELGDVEVEFSLDQEDAQVGTADLKQSKENSPKKTNTKKANEKNNKQSNNDKFAYAKKGKNAKEANIVAAKKNNDVKAEESSVNQAVVENQPADTKQDKAEANDNHATVEKQNVDNNEENNEPSPIEYEQGTIIKTAYAKVAVEKSGEWGNSTKG